MNDNDNLETNKATNQRIQNQTIAKQQQKIDEQAAAKTVQIGAKAAANYFAPGVGGAAVDLAANTKAGQQMLNTAGQALNKVPGMARNLDNLNKSGALDTANSALNIMGGSKGTKSASNVQANRMNPGDNLQGVVKNDDLDFSSNSQMPSDLEENKQESSRESEADNKNESFKNSAIFGNTNNKLLKFLLNHPAIAMAVAGIGLMIIIIFLVLLIVLSNSENADAKEDNNSSNSSSNVSSTNETNSCNQLESKSLSETLSENNSTVNDFNNNLIKAVKNVGVGTRDGVVTAAISITSDLCDKYKVRLPYEWGGGHENMYYGIKESWGSALANPIYENSRAYRYSGLDCSGYVSWAIYNGGFNFTSKTANEFTSLGSTHPMASEDFIGKPGDLIHHDGHIMIIVGVDEASKQYSVAEAAGADEGMRVIKMPFNGGSSKKNSIIDMSSFYENTSNKTTNYPEATN